MTSIAENVAPRANAPPGAAKIEMVHRADHAAEGIQDDVEIDDAQSRVLAHHSQKDEHVGDDHGRKQLEKILHPKMHDPEAPEIVDHEALMRAGKKTTA